MRAAGAILASLLCAQGWPTAASDLGRTMVHVKGQSGKFTIYKENEGKDSGIEITMDALYERDIDGNKVGKSGNPKHSIESFATQDFTIEPIENVTLVAGQIDDSVDSSDDDDPLLSVAAEKIGFYSPISEGEIGQVRIDTYVIQEDGLLGPPNETWVVKTGDLKWNIELSSWYWCGCYQGNGPNAVEEVGEMIDVVVTVKGLLDASQGASSKSINLGGGVSLELSDQVNVDGVWTPMPAGYPDVSMQGQSVQLTFRFPKFTDRAVYDPKISFPDDEDDGTTNPEDDGTTNPEDDGSTDTEPGEVETNTTNTTAGEVEADDEANTTTADEEATTGTTVTAAGEEETTIAAGEEETTTTTEATTTTDMDLAAGSLVPAWLLPACLMTLRANAA